MEVAGSMAYCAAAGSAAAAMRRITARSLQAARQTETFISETKPKRVGLLEILVTALGAHRTAEGGCFGGRGGGGGEWEDGGRGGAAGARESGTRRGQLRAEEARTKRLPSNLFAYTTKRGEAYS